MGIDYEGGKEFRDPVVRCYDCGELVHRIWIEREAGCNHCGVRKFKNVQAFKKHEKEQLDEGTFDFGLEKEEWFPIDPDFFALFEWRGK